MPKTSLGRWPLVMVRIMSVHTLNNSGSNLRCILTPREGGGAAIGLPPKGTRGPCPRRRGGHLGGDLTVKGEEEGHRPPLSGLQGRRPLHTTPPAGPVECPSPCRKERRKSFRPGFFLRPGGGVPGGPKTRGNFFSLPEKRPNKILFFSGRTQSGREVPPRGVRP